MAKNIIQKLIGSCDFTHKNNELKVADEQIELYSNIKKGVLVKADERDMDINGNYKVPAGVHKIASYAFSDCKYVNSVILGNDVKTIDEHAFCNCGVKYIDLGGVENIKAWAFSFCVKLQEVKLSRELKYVNRDIFFNCISLKKFITPTGDIILRGSMFANRADAQDEIQAYIDRNKMLAK